MTEELEVISVRVTKPLADLIKEYLKLNAHVTMSDFIRDAIRDKIKNEAPWLYQRMLKKNMEASG